MNLPLSVRSSASIVSPVKPHSDDRIHQGDMSGTLVTESESNDDSFLDDHSMKQVATSEVVQSLKAMDDSRSVNSCKSETSIHLASSSSCTSSQSDFSTSDGDSDLDLEEALMKALLADNESVELPSELIVPYPDESGGCQGRPIPWDCSSSDGTNSSTPMLTHEQVARKIEVVASKTTDNQPLVPRRRRSNEALSNSEDSQSDISRHRKSHVCERVVNEAVPSDLFDFLMSRLPSSIASKLDDSDWSRVCSEMTNYAQSNGTWNALEERVHKPSNNRASLDRNGGCYKDDIESCSVISELTGTTGLTGPTEQRNQRANDTGCSKSMDDVSLLMLPEKLNTQSSRAWHDSSKCLSEAPIMPIRRGRYPLDRTNSEPRSQYSFPRGFSRSSSLPCDLVSINRRSVSFDTVQVRQYEPVLDLNPSTSSGPSVGIGWNYFVESERKLTEVEDEKDRCGRRSMREIIIPRRVREQTLKDCGYTTKEIAKAVRMNLKSKGQRMQTIHNYKIDQIVERSSRKVRRLFHPRKASACTND